MVVCYMERNEEGKRILKMNIALVAHDGRKQEMLEWVKYNYKILLQHNLFATGTTGKLIKEIGIDTVEKVTSEVTYQLTIHKILKPLEDKVTCLLSGPLGGDQQIGAMIAEGKIDCLIFFCDNLITQGHQNDVSALTRLASLYNISFAPNRTTADMILTSLLFDSKEYNRLIPKCIEDYKNRKL